MAQIKGKRVLVTGASGLVAFPVAAKLAQDNEVFAVARYSDPEQKRMIEQAGATAVSFDLANPDLSPLPDKIDVVINYAVLPPKFGNLAYDGDTRKAELAEITVAELVFELIVSVEGDGTPVAPSSVVVLAQPIPG